MLTRSSEGIFNPSRYTGFINIRNVWSRSAEPVHKTEQSNNIYSQNRKKYKTVAVIYADFLLSDCKVPPRELTERKISSIKKRHVQLR